MTRKSVQIFWDNSNIFLGAQTTYRNLGRSIAGSIRVDFENLFELARANRTVDAAYCVGSVPPELEAVWKKLRSRTGIVPELYERGRGSNKEQAVDQALQVYMLRALVDSPPAIAVLLTGDGAGYFDGAGFHADLERMHKNGWGIEVLSWDGCCKPQLRDWAKSVGVYVPLDNFIDQLSFEQGVTRVKQLNLKSRALAK
jgi:hypothetical protein